MRIFMIIIHTGKKILIVFDDMIGDIMTNKKFQTIIKELKLLELCHNKRLFDYEN